MVYSEELYNLFGPRNSSVKAECHARGRPLCPGPSVETSQLPVLIFPLPSDCAEMKCKTQTPEAKGADEEDDYDECRKEEFGRRRARATSYAGL